MPRPVAVQRTEQTLSFDHLPQGRHHRPRRFLLHQLRVIYLAGGVIQNHHQVVPALVLKPLVLAAVDVQQHPRQRSPRAPPPMRPTPLTALHQPGPLQRPLYPGVAQLDPMLLSQLLVKVPYVEAHGSVTPQSASIDAYRRPKLDCCLAAWMA
jgi:hypothetical protein